LDVAHSVGALALGNKVEAPGMLREPDLDFTRLTGDAAIGGQDTVGLPAYQGAIHTSSI
jgi:hypothetical protein